MYVRTAGLRLLFGLAVVGTTAGCAGTTGDAGPTEAAAQTVTATITETVTAAVTETVTASAPAAAPATSEQPTSATPKPTSETTDKATSKGVQILESGWGYIYDQGISWGVVVRNDTGEDLWGVEIEAVARDADGTLLDSGSEDIDGIPAGGSRVLGGVMHDALGVDSVDFRVGDRGNPDGEDPKVEGTVEVESTILADPGDGGIGDLGFEVTNNTDYELLDLLSIGYVFRGADGSIIGGGRALLSSALGPNEGTGFTVGEPIPRGTASIEAQPNYARDQFGNP